MNKIRLCSRAGHWHQLGRNFGKCLLLFILLNFCCCKQNTSEKENAIAKSEQEKLEDRKKIESEIVADSLKLEKILNKALAISLNKIEKKTFKKNYETSTDDGSHNPNSISVSVNIVYGNIFSQKVKHLIIRRFIIERDLVLINIYELKNNKLEPLIYRNQDGMTYLDDTIRDVNGDGRKDFLVHWYPSSGCCRRNVYNVYLQDNQGKFSKDYEFINPTFYPDEKIIRGVQYGYGADLYKYKWNNLNVDTIEFIKKDTEKPNKYYITKKSDYNNPPIVKNRIVNKIPKEYKEIIDIDWFAD
jgi:hypothetical protein